MRPSTTVHAPAPLGDCTTAANGNTTAFFALGRIVASACSPSVRRAGRSSMRISTVSCSVTRSLSRRMRAILPRNFCPAIERNATSAPSPTANEPASRSSTNTVTQIEAGSASLRIGAPGLTAAPNSSSRLTTNPSMGLSICVSVCRAVTETSAAAAALTSWGTAVNVISCSKTSFSATWYNASALLNSSSADCAAVIRSSSSICATSSLPANLRQRSAFARARVRFDLALATAAPAAATPAWARDKAASWAGTASLARSRIARARSTSALNSEFSSCTSLCPVRTVSP